MREEQKGYIWTMGIFQTALILAAFSCSLAAGLLFAFQVVVMPGIKNLSDKEFIRAFQVTDRIIQDNQPVFILVWAGSAIAILVSAFSGLGRLQGLDLVLLVSAALAYIFVVQLSTIIIHLPLNNKLQELDVDVMQDAELELARNDFESRWNRSNLVRTVTACCVSALLILLLYRL